MFKRAAVAVAALCILSISALAQGGGWAASVSGGDIITKQVQGNGVTQTATQSSLLLFSLRRHLVPRFGVEVNYGRSRNSQKYAAGTLSYRIHDQLSEFTGALVFSPYSTTRLETFVLGGGGVLYFSPNTVTINNNPVAIQTSREGRGAFLYGVGADYHLFSRFALRLQYRGLFYSPPDFKVQVTPLFTGARGHMAEPSVGIMFRF
jgi:opacity protein-like surface antigen